MWMCVCAHIRAQPHVTACYSVTRGVWERVNHARLFSIVCYSLFDDVRTFCHAEKCEAADDDYRLYWLLIICNIYADADAYYYVCLFRLCIFETTYAGLGLLVGHFDSTSWIRLNDNSSFFALCMIPSLPTLSFYLSISISHDGVSPFHNTKMNSFTL